MVEVETETTNFGRYFKWITGINYDKKLHEYDKKLKRHNFAIADVQIDVKKLKSKL